MSRREQVIVVMFVLIAFFFVGYKFGYINGREEFEDDVCSERAVVALSLCTDKPFIGEGE